MRADEGIGPYEGLHNRTLNYNLKPQKTFDRRCTP